jgi:hypothetical protein
MHNPTTWPRQGQLAHEAKWEEHRAWQDQFDGGKLPEWWQRRRYNLSRLVCSFVDLSQQIYEGILKSALFTMKVSELYAINDESFQCASDDVFVRGFQAQAGSALGFLDHLHHRGC